MKLRSLLYVPADNETFIRNAHQRGADAIILDLEDAVKAEHKTPVRRNLPQSVEMCRQSGAVVLMLPKQIVHLAAKSRGLLSLGLIRSVANYSDLPAMQAAATEAKRFGFDGESCVHPKVVRY